MQRIFSRNGSWRARVLLPLLLATGLSACMSLGPRAIYELSRFDPFTADPAGIAVAVRTDKALHLKDGDVVMRVARPDADPAKAFDETFRLAIWQTAADPKLGAAMPPSDHIIAARFADADLARYREVQAKARAARAQPGGKGRGTLSVTVTGGCRSGPLEGRRITVATFMRTQAAGGFFPLTGAMDLADMLGGKPVGGIPSCT